MCNCKKDIEEKLLNRFIEKTPDAKSHCVKLEGYTLVLQDNRLLQKGYMDVTLTAAFQVKKTGEFKAKKQTEFMTFNFCPFCGKAYEEQQEVAS